MAKEILIIEEEGFIASLLRKNLLKKGYDITILERKEALRQVRKHKANLVLLEANASGVEASETCRLLREATTVPIIVLTDSTAKLGEVEGIEYLTKPLDFHELLTVMERALNHPPKRKKRMLRILRIGDLALDLQTHHLTTREHRYHLRPKEFSLLRLFMSNPGRVMSHKVIMKEVWDTDYLGDTRTLYVHVNWLRQKIEDTPKKPVHLRTVRGVGYRFEINP